MRKNGEENGAIEMVRIFEDASNDEGNYVLPTTNAILESRIKNVANGDVDEVQGSLQRAKDYMRAVGRIILHSFLNEHTVSTSAMPPFFINGKSSIQVGLVFTLSSNLLD